MPAFDGEIVDNHALEQHVRADTLSNRAYCSKVTTPPQLQCICGLGSARIRLVGNQSNTRGRKGSKEIKLEHRSFLIRPHDHPGPSTPVSRVGPCQTVSLIFSANHFPAQNDQTYVAQAGYGVRMGHQAPHTLHLADSLLLYTSRHQDLHDAQRAVKVNGNETHTSFHAR